MLKFTINGRPVRPQDLAKEMTRAAATSVAEQVRERVSAIRHPDSGEFATVVVEGDTLDDMSFCVEGSASLLEIVKARLSPEEMEGMAFVATDGFAAPRAFLSYGWEDRELARRIAEGLQGQGIDTWWAEWEIGAGDSIRRKIDAGLNDCTHFIVLLTPASITRPWVNEEMDAGFVRKVNAKCRFIPLRHGLEASALPPLLQGMLSPAISDEARDLRQLVNDIHGVGRKPALGPAPMAANGPRTGYTAAATAIAGLFVAESQHGQFADPQLTVDEIGQRTGLSADDVEDALHELRHRLQVSFGRVLPKSSLYSEFDRHWQPWDPAADALRLAADLVNDPGMPNASGEIAARYGWTPRRLNPALTYLEERAAIRISEAIGSAPYVTIRVARTDATRRFVKSRSDGANSHRAQGLG
ncbi:toll/interleukin-1 receptor domain-containing protein [Methylorubrum extorquens]|uniref:TIR protein n=1 Tax=Methylorubrum extorquens (strain CM4 / NCIMB 13688) TaxID=440085 RepID=B7L2Y1_METC4|nr:toll/interleukin-1 receptor domain-containing protein [Methylorubrum extorquens]ACK86189.1 TIR protein [Methylorubrum extorquens CM4]